MNSLMPDTLACDAAVAAPAHDAAVRMFGPLSSPACTPVVPVCADVTQSVLFQLLAATLLVLLCISIGRDVLRSAFRMRRGDTLSAHPEAGRQSGVVSFSAVTGIVLIMCAAVKYGSLWMPAAWTGEGSLTALRAACAACAAAALCGCFQAGVIAVAGVVTREHEFTEGLMAIKKTFFSIAALTVSPLFILAAMSSSGIWTAVLAAECCILALIFIKETITFFVEKKVPILLWFLYLCIVEVFPLTLAVASVARFR